MFPVYKMAFGFSILFVLGCGSTPYQKIGLRGGYSDVKISDGSYELYFQGNAVTSRETIEEYWHRRAGDLCDGKYDYEYVEIETRRDLVYVSDPELFGKVTCKQ